MVAEKQVPLVSLSANERNLHERISVLERDNRTLKAMAVQLCKTTSFLIDVLLSSPEKSFGKGVDFSSPANPTFGMSGEPTDGGERPGAR